MQDHDKSVLWEQDVYDEAGAVDMEKLERVLQSSPELLNQFRSMYANGDESVDAADGAMATQTLQELYSNCVLQNVTSALESIAPVLLACFICSIVTRLSRRYVTHSTCCLLGLLILHRFFAESSLLLVLYSCVACFLLCTKALRRHVGVVLSTLTLIFVVACEFVIPAERWHSVRGAQMVLSMKAISLGFDLSNETVKDAPILETAGYLLHPGSVIFGPWIPYQYYIDGIGYSRRWLDWRWCLHIVKTFCLSMLFLVWSSCIISYLLPEYDSWGRWPDAYRDAQSFRASHYFVCHISELTLVLSGIAVFSADGDLSSGVQVSQPLNIEMPRSLVEVVTSWNLPMHKWLKNYVFKIARPKFGNFMAIILTYVSSSLLHGLNFQLAAVLLSLGFYSYIEHSLRHRLADTFSLCIEAKRCNQCEHRHGHLHIASILINVSFTCLAMYHLAYLGVMFDTSESQQEKGYSMFHTLSKWSNLDYSSHIVALCTYAFYWLIK